MSLQTRLEALVAAIGTDVKTIRTAQKRDIQGVTPVAPATGTAVEWTADGKSLDMRAADGVVTRIGPSSGGGSGTKVSALPAATLLDGTELVPIVQGGITERATVSEIRGSGGGGGLPKLTSRLTAAVTSGSDVYNSTGLSVPLTSGKVYRITAFGQYRTPATTTGIGLRLGGTGGLTATRVRWNAFIYGFTATSLTLRALGALNFAVAPTTAVATANTDFGWSIDGLIVVNVGGTLSVDFASEVVTSVVTVQPDSYLEAQEVA
jgi:hypothetical protein